MWFRSAILDSIANSACFLYLMQSCLCLHKIQQSNERITSYMIKKTRRVKAKEQITETWALIYDLFGRSEFLILLSVKLLNKLTSSRRLEDIKYINQRVFVVAIESQLTGQIAHTKNKNWRTAQNNILFRIDRLRYKTFHCLTNCDFLKITRLFEKVSPNNMCGILILLICLRIYYFIFAFEKRKSQITFFWTLNKKMNAGRQSSGSQCHTPLQRKWKREVPNYKSKWKGHTIHSY